mgnify:CR=1 FL=1
MLNFTDKVIAITGADGGIGQATAQCIIDAGGRVVLGDVNQTEINKKLSQWGERAIGCTVDVTQSEDNQAMIDQALSAFGRLDGLFLNAGIEGRVGAFETQTQADWQRVFAVNVDGPRLGALAALPALEKSGGGSVVMTSSVAGVRGVPNLSPYVTSKHALLGLMRTLAAEWGPKGIRVNALNPGPVDNRMMQSIEEQSSPGHGSDIKAAFTSRIPLGRYVTNEECAQMAAFLLSDNSAGATGNTYMVDGGYCAG